MCINILLTSHFLFSFLYLPSFSFWLSFFVTTKKDNRAMAKPHSSTKLGHMMRGNWRGAWSRRTLRPVQQLRAESWEPTWKKLRFVGFYSQANFQFLKFWEIWWWKLEKFQIQIFAVSRWVGLGVCEKNLSRKFHWQCDNIHVKSTKNLCSHDMSVNT